MCSDRVHPVKCFPKWFRFRLRTMLVGITLICIIAGFLSIRVNHLQDIWALQSCAGVRLDIEGNSSLRQASWPLGKDFSNPFFKNIRTLLFAQLEYLIVFDRNDSNTRLSQLQFKRFPHLKGISSANTGIVDEDLQAIAELTQLEELSLENTAISDRGLLHLSRLTALKSIDLRNTAVTEQGIRQLQEILPNCKIQN